MRIYVAGLITSWADEIFADIFAIKTLGPAFHLACLEFEQALSTDIERNRNFSITHPADDFRFKMHANWLKEGKWFDIIKNRTPLVFKQLEDCEKLEIKNGDFEISCKPPLEGNDALEKELHIWMLTKFEILVEKIEQKIKTKFDDFKNPIDDFNINDTLVTTCLEHGIVPSTVYDEDKQKHHPNPTTVLNSGFFFYLGRMNKLLEKVKSNESHIDKRINYEKRLNQWLGKAIDDWQILHKEKKL
ncbi:MAG: hypothetical protein A2173_06380 [Planctomycetes bacterium RBG_13_44_8b]|nr:MAG: hypothetical protein A2173_06380 [Planctomycetes bacterium RBG_13_44_8b]